MFTAPRRLCIAPQAPTPASASAHTTEKTSREMKNAFGGVFVPDPALGFPPGAPISVPKEMSWHSIVHGFAPILGFLALIAAFVVLARRFRSEGSHIWMWASIVVGVATLVLTSLPNMTGDWKTGRFNFLPLWAGVALGYAYASLVIATLKKELEGSHAGPTIPSKAE
jgi:Protein of unknown function (DUF998)